MSGTDEAGEMEAVNRGEPEAAANLGEPEAATSRGELFVVGDGSLGMIRFSVEDGDSTRLLYIERLWETRKRV